MKRKKRTSLYSTSLYSEYSIARNCSDIADCQVGIQEVENIRYDLLYQNKSTKLANKKLLALHNRLDFFKKKVKKGKK